MNKHGNLLFIMSESVMSELEHSIKTNNSPHMPLSLLSNQIQTLLIQNEMDGSILHYLPVKLFMVNCNDDGKLLIK